MNGSYDFANQGMRTFASGFSRDRKNNFLINDIVSIGALSTGRKTRCTDRFVRYPYPKAMNSYYNREYANKIHQAKILTENDAFNLEKETKIINPHPMELSTTNKINFQPFKVTPKTREMRLLSKNDAPIVK